MTSDPTTPSRAEVSAAVQAGVVARRVSELAAAKDLSAAALAKSIGVKSERVARVLDGEAPEPALLQLLAAGLGVTVADLVRAEAYLSTEVAALTGVTSRTVLQWVQSRRVTGDRAENGRYWVPADEVDRLIESGGRPERRRGGKVPFAPVNDLGLKIFALMHKRKLTQVELSRLCGVSQSRLSTIMSGRPGQDGERAQYSPSIDRLQKIAAGLGVTPAELLMPVTDDERATVESILRTAA